MKGLQVGLMLVAMLAGFAVAEAPAAEGLERLAVLKSQFEELREDATSAQAKFDARYEEELKKLESKATESGNLALVVAAREEAANFRARKGAAAASDQPEVARMQKIYSDQTARILVEQKEKTDSLVTGYRTKLAELRVELTKDGQIDAALEVQAEIDSLNRAWPRGSGAGPVKPPPGSDPPRLGEGWRYKSGLVVALYPRTDRQVRDAGFVPYRELKKMEPERRPGELRSLRNWGYQENRNAAAVGYLKIEVPGEYQFNSISFYDRNALYVLNEDSPLCGYRDGEGKVQTITLPKGMVRIISIGYVDARGQCNVRWKPPGQDGLSAIPEELLYHTDEDTGG